MATGGSSGRAASGSRSFDFGSDDVLCSYDDFAAQDPSNAVRSDPPPKDYHQSRNGKPLVSIYDKEEFSREDVMFAVEKCMKKYADNLLRSLDGISGRLSQLEIHCYKLDRSIGEFRADIIRDHAEADQRFKTLEKHIQEVHRSVQIVRDKQELAETQKELAKLQLAHKESSQEKEEIISQSASELKRLDDKPDMANQQLALALPHQTVAPVIPARAPEQVQPYKEAPVHRQAPVAPNVQQDRYVVNQPGTYYPQQSLPLQPDLQYAQPRPQDTTVQAPPQQPQIVTQNQSPSFPQHQQQWPPQLTQQFPQQAVQQQPPPQQFPQQAVQQQPPPQQFPQQAVQQQPPPHGQIRPQGSYPPYLPPSANSNPETFPVNTSIQGSYPAGPQPNSLRPESPYGYGGPGGSVSQPPTQHNIQRQTQAPANQNSFGSQPTKSGYMGPAAYPPQYMQGYSNAYNYQPTNLQGVQNQQLPPSNSSGVQQHGSQLRAHPFGDMIEKAVGMGYPRDHVLSVVQRMAESGQAMDFNALLDRLNGQARGW